MWKLKKFIHKSPPKRRFWNGIYSLLMRADIYIFADRKGWKADLSCLDDTVYPQSGQLSAVAPKRIWKWGHRKSKPPTIFQKFALKIANEIRFLRKVKVNQAL